MGHAYGARTANMNTLAMKSTVCSVVPVPMVRAREARMGITSMVMEAISVSIADQLQRGHVRVARMGNTTNRNILTRRCTGRGIARSLPRR